MRALFNNVSQSIKQTAEDIGFGFILPASSDRQRTRETLQQSAASLLLLGGLMFPNMQTAGGTNISGFLAAYGALALGMFALKYQAKGQEIRQSLNAATPSPRV